METIEKLESEIHNIEEVMSVKEQEKVFDLQYSKLSQKRKILLKVWKQTKQMINLIDKMISFSEKKKKELEKREADLIEIVPHIDYVAVLNELKSKINGNNKSST